VARPCVIKLEFHEADTDTDTYILARILADTSDTRDFLKLFLWQAERHADILATILARMSVSVSASWNASLTPYPSKNRPVSGINVFVQLAAAAAAADTDSFDDIEDESSSIRHRRCPLELRRTTAAVT